MLPDVAASASSKALVLKAADWLKGGVRSGRARLAASIGGLGKAPAPRAAIDEILYHWPIGKCRVRAASSGTSRSVFIVRSDADEFVLRREAGDELAWVEFQVAVLRQLQERRFPYQTPSLVATSASTAHHFDGNDYWYLYRYIRGTQALEPDCQRRAAALGALVAHFAAALDGFAVGRFADAYGLELCRTESSSAGLAAAFERLTKSRSLRRLEALLRQSRDVILRGYGDITAAQTKAANSLAKSAIYYDWHNKNIICRRGAIRGLIDYDSLAAAPRLVDFQNALTYVMVGKKTLDRELMSAFADSYNEVAPLTTGEIELLRPVMIDRAVWLLGQLLERLRETGHRHFEERARRLVHALTWIIANGDELAQIAAPR